MSSVHFWFLAYSTDRGFQNYRWFGKEIIPKNYLESPEEAKEDDQEAPENYLYHKFSRNSFLFDVVLVFILMPFNFNPHFSH